MFKRKKNAELPPEIRRAAEALMTAQEIYEGQPQPANYSTALDWLLGLSDADYKKMIKVVEIYRGANSETAKTLRIKTAPTSFLPQPDNTEPVPQDVNHLAPASATGPTDEENFLDDDDDLAAAFLEDEPEKPAAAPAKVEVKDENDKAQPKG